MACGKLTIFCGKSETRPRKNDWPLPVFWLPLMRLLTTLTCDSGPEAIGEILVPVAWREIFADKSGHKDGVTLREHDIRPICSDSACTADSHNPPQERGRLIPFGSLLRMLCQASWHVPAASVLTCGS